MLCALVAAAGCGSGRDAGAEPSASGLTLEVTPSVVNDETGVAVRVLGARDLPEVVQGLLAVLEQQEGDNWVPTHYLAARALPADPPDLSDVPGTVATFQEGGYEVNQPGFGPDQMIPHPLPKDLASGRYRIVKEVSVLTAIGPEARYAEERVVGEFEVR